jgi:predicted TIM-barrel fold metal-dependent hydrolase
MKKKPVINCHTHIFTGDHVPPYLAKTVAPPPLYYLINLAWVVRFFRRYHAIRNKIVYSPWMKRFEIVKNETRIFINKFEFIKTLFTIGLTGDVLFVIYRHLMPYLPKDENMIMKALRIVYEFLSSRHLLLSNGKLGLEIFFTIFLILFLPSGRNFIFAILKKIIGILSILPSKQTKDLAKRYLNIGRYAFHQQQRTIFTKLKDQYPEGTGFVVLPMDMEYMDAGKVRTSYKEQMEELAYLKKKKPDTFFPFVFADPRRMKEDPTQFKYTHSQGKVMLEDCFFKTYLETNQFNGIKIYPALGYYVFDDMLLPLWKYAADHQIPITTHCIRGTIYYRGSKKDEWNRHEVFEQANGHNQFTSLLLPQMSAMDNSYNFTHPLNYLCLLEEILLRKVVMNSNDHIKSLFGFTNADTPLLYNLSHLKICFAHFGGDDEWLRFFERDRDNYSSQLVKNPAKGIDFLHDDEGKIARGKPEIIWKSVDWYTIITSLMLQYPNVYADISYILHDETSLLPLLKQTLANAGLKQRVLFGTDFFVVRNHKSDKQMLADMMCGLTEEEFDTIARENPVCFLERC